MTRLLELTQRTDVPSCLCMGGIWLFFHSSKKQRSMMNNPNKGENHSKVLFNCMPYRGTDQEDFSSIRFFYNLDFKMVSTVHKVYSNSPPFQFPTCLAARQARLCCSDGKMCKFPPLEIILTSFDSLL